MEERDKKCQQLLSYAEQRDSKEADLCGSGLFLHLLSKVLGVRLDPSVQPGDRREHGQARGGREREKWKRETYTKGGTDRKRGNE